MHPGLEAASRYCAEIADLTAAVGNRVALRAEAALDRSDSITLAAPGRISPNGSCRLLQAQDGWLAVNLPRATDWALLPAWLGPALTGADTAGWEDVARAVARNATAPLLEMAHLLGLAVTQTAEARGPGIIPHRYSAVKQSGELNVVDLSALWAGPLCGAVFAAMGARVTKIESFSRPDPARAQTAFFTRLNGGKQQRTLEFSAAALGEIINHADILITSARLRAFAQIGLTPEQVYAENPTLIWVAISGHGWHGEGANRIGFGDDAAAAGGLLGWTEAGAPYFLGDALADPLTGLAAAAAALRAVHQGGGVILDAAMARVAAEAAQTK